MAQTELGQQLQIYILKYDLALVSGPMYVLAGLGLASGVLMGLLAYMAPYHSAAAAVLLVSGLLVAAAFVGLGVWARHRPLSASIVALALYCSTVALQVIAYPPALLQSESLPGWVLQALVILYLCRGIKVARQYEITKSSLDQVLPPPLLLTSSSRTDSTLENTLAR